MIIVRSGFFINRSSFWQISQLQAIRGWQTTLLDAAQEMTALAMISVRRRTSSVSGSTQRRVWSRLVTCTRLRLCRWVAALDRQLTPVGDGVPFRSRTRLATRVAPELIGVPATLGHRRVVRRAPQRRVIASTTEQRDAVGRYIAELSSGWVWM